MTAIFEKCLHSSLTGHFSRKTVISHFLAVSIALSLDSQSVYVLWLPKSCESDEPR